MIKKTTGFLSLVFAMYSLTALANMPCAEGDIDLGDGYCVSSDRLCYPDKVEGCDDGDPSTIDSCVYIGLPGSEFGECFNDPDPNFVRAATQPFTLNALSNEDIFNIISTGNSCAQNDAHIFSLFALIALFWRRKSGRIRRS